MMKKWYVIVPLVILGIVVFLGVGGEVVRQLWNWLLPPLLGVRQITFWQALGILALCRILFGGFGGAASNRSDARRCEAGAAEPMTKEERERFRELLRERWAADPAAESEGE